MAFRARPFGAGIAAHCGVDARNARCDSSASVLAQASQLCRARAANGTFLGYFWHVERVIWRGGEPENMVDRGALRQELQLAAASTCDTRRVRNVGTTCAANRRCGGASVAIVVRASRKPHFPWLFLARLVSDLAQRRARKRGPPCAGRCGHLAARVAGPHRFDSRKHAALAALAPTWWRLGRVSSRGACPPGQVSRGCR
jgi:hypothetical protein